MQPSRLAIATLAVTSLALTAAEARPNLIQNGRFDSSVTGWTSKNTLSWVTNDSRGALGSGSAKLTNSALLTALAGSSCATVEPGEDLVVGGRVWVSAATAGDNGYLGVTFYGADDCDHTTGLSSVLSQRITSGGWHEVAQHAVVPTNAHSVSVSLGAARGGGASGTLLVFFDDVHLVRGSCVPGDDQSALCLADERFEVKATWTANGQSGAGVAERLNEGSGNFWFFGPNNIELDVKVLDACALNGRYWVFAAGLTNVKVDLTVTDTETGAAKTYHNAAGHVFTTITDTSAFDTCP